MACGQLAQQPTKRTHICSGLGLPLLSHDSCRPVSRIKKPKRPPQGCKKKTHILYKQQLSVSVKYIRKNTDVSKDIHFRLKKPCIDLFINLFVWYSATLSRMREYTSKVNLQRLTCINGKYIYELMVGVGTDDTCRS